jgi:dihydrofolate reductase
MVITLIAAVAANRVIGRGGRLPWRIPDDLERFKRITMGHPLIMGRRTFESLGRALPGRAHVVLTRDPAWRAEGCHSARTAEEALAAAAAAPGAEQVFVIGGASVFALFLPLARRMLITWVDAEVAGDVRFPEPRWEEWRALSTEPGAAGPLPHRFVDYERVDAGEDAWGAGGMKPAVLH